MTLEEGKQYVTKGGEKINMKRYQDKVGIYAYNILKILDKTNIDYEEQEKLLEEHHIIDGHDANVHNIVSDGLRHAESGICLSINTGGANVNYKHYDIDLDDTRNK